MTTFKRAFSAKASIFSGTVAATEALSSDLDLETSGYLGAQVIVDVNYGTKAKYGDMAVNVYGGLGTTNYDDVAAFAQNIGSSSTPNQISMVIKDLLHFKLGFVGTSSSYGSVDANYQAWRYDTV